MLRRMYDTHAASPIGAMRLASANAALWAIGNGLVSTLLVIYLASDLGASGLSLSLILTAPRFAGLLRLGVPALMARLFGLGRGEVEATLTGLARTGRVSPPFEVRGWPGRWVVSR